MSGIDLDAYLNAIKFIDALDQRYEANRGAGWVYILRNEEFRHPVLKIGMTKRGPHERAAELGSTSTPGHFEVIYFVHVCDARMAEQFVHEMLASSRYKQNKEFFAVSIGRAVGALNEAARSFPLLRSQRNKGSRNPRSKPLPQAFGAQIMTCVGCGKKNRVPSLAISLHPKCAGCGEPIGG